MRYQFIYVPRLRVLSLEPTSLTGSTVVVCLIFSESIPGPFSNHPEPVYVFTFLVSARVGGVSSDPKPKVHNSVYELSDGSSVKCEVV